MTYQQPTNVIGQTINAWDQFYLKHFDVVYRQALDICQNTLLAKDLTDRLFAKALLKKPESILENTAKAIKDQLAILIPYNNQKVDRNKEINAGRLLHLYYCQN